jgi:hypothetical protein
MSHAQNICRTFNTMKQWSRGKRRNLVQPQEKSRGQRTGRSSNLKHGAKVDRLQVTPSVSSKLYIHAWPSPSTQNREPRRTETYCVSTCTTLVHSSQPQFLRILIFSVMSCLWQSTIYLIKLDKWHFMFNVTLLTWRNISGQFPFRSTHEKWR